MRTFLFSSLEYPEEIFSYTEVQLKEICLPVNTTCLASEMLASFDVEGGPIRLPMSSLNTPLLLDAYCIYFIQLSSVIMGQILL